MSTVESVRTYARPIGDDDVPTARKLTAVIADVLRDDATDSPDGATGS